jgi:hypothetical protein
MSFLARLSAALLMGVALVGGEVLESAAQTEPPVTLAPTQIRTVGQSRCGPSTLSTAGTNCQGFDAREIREQSTIFVVGYENNQDLAEKHVLQVVAVFDLAAARGAPGTEVSNGSLHYGEGSTTRRSASGESEYGILPTCNTGLGVPSAEWDGRTDSIVPTTPAATAGVTPATTGDYGAWDLTPQLNAWLASGQPRGTLVLRSDDESLDIHGQAMCLSYLSDLNLTVEYRVLP